ncbi:hypothetical protein GWI33_013402, partial [Rhynchophorus ferrugineus]
TKSSFRSKSVAASTSIKYYQYTRLIQKADRD